MNSLSRMTIAVLTLLLTLVGMTDVGAASFTHPLGCGVVATDFRVTTFASGLNFPYGMERLADGSLIVATSLPKTSTSGYFATTGELRRFVDSNADGVADGPGTVVYTGLPGALTALRRAGTLLFVTSAATAGITVLRIGEPYTRVGEITFQFPLAGTEPWYHKSYALEVRPTGAGANTFDLFFNVGSQFNSEPTTGLVQVGGLVAAVSVNGDAIHKITVTDDSGGPTFSAPVQIASGLRNAAGIAIRPVSGDLYFTDNGIDGLVVDTEPLSVDELNVIPFDQIGEPHFFGFPLSYTEYRTGRVVGGAGIQPVVTFQPLAGMTAPESEGPALMVMAPAAFPSPVNDGVFIGFHGQPAYGIANEENPLVFYSFANGTYCHFVSNDEPNVGHLNGLLSTADALFVADMASNGWLTHAGAGTGVIYQIMAVAGGTLVSVAATDAVATEAGSTTATLTVTRSGSTASELTVLYAVTGTASAGSDYEPLFGSVPIPVGSASAVITITPVNDTVVEGNETVTVTLSGGAGYTVGAPNSATVTIVSDDMATVTIAATDPTATEAGRTTGTFTVSRTGSTTAPLTVFYAVAGTATAGSDYPALPGSVTIAAGALSAPIVITPTNDGLMEGDETVVLTLKANAAYTVGGSNTATLTIVSDEAVTIAATDATATEKGTTTGRFTVSRTGTTVSPLTVFYSIGGTAKAGSDYSALQGSVTIPAGALSAPITVTPINDALMEGPESVTLTLAARATYTVGAASSATVTIISDERVTIAATDSTATEAGRTTGRFTVSRTGSATAPLTVFYTVGGTATAGSDYIALPGSVTIPAGAVSAAIIVTPISDILMEATETVVLTLAARATYMVGTPSSATVNVVSDEKVTMVATDATATEAGRTTGRFMVSRTGSTAAPLTVFYTVGGTATAGSDYIALPGNVTIPVGVLSAPVTITPINDLLRETAETVVLTVAGRATYTVGTPSSATVTIASDD